MDVIDWLDAQGTSEAHAARDELTELRAFKAACEGQEAAARLIPVMLPDRQMAWARTFEEYSQESSRNNPYRSGEEMPLYLHPDPEAAQLRMRLADLERQLANERASAIHTCGPDCQRPGCVERRERDQRVAEACAMVCEEKRARYLEHFSTISARAAGDIGAELRSGEWKKHMKGVD